MVRGGLRVLNKNSMPESVIGSKKSYSTLKAMTKDELIELLGIAQHNYECVNESLFNITQHAEKLDRALDKACEELDNMSFLLSTEEVRTHYSKDDWRELLMTDIQIGSCPIDMCAKDIIFQKSCTNDVKKSWEDFVERR